MSSQDKYPFYPDNGTWVGYWEAAWGDDDAAVVVFELLRIDKDTQLKQRWSPLETKQQLRNE